jgi:hypothetical protein
MEADEVKTKNEKVENELKLNNSFRDEVGKAEKTPIELETEKVGSDAMLMRDQHVTMRKLQVNKQMLEEDIEYTQAAIVRYLAFVEELQSLPVSQARDDVVEQMLKQVEILERQVEGSTFSRASEVVLDALERLFEAPIEKEELASEEEIEEPTSEELDDKDENGETEDDIDDDDQYDEEPQTTQEPTGGAETVTGEGEVIEEDDDDLTAPELQDE